MKHLYAGMAFLAAAHVCFAQATLGPPETAVLPPALQAPVVLPTGSVRPPVVQATLGPPETAVLPPAVQAPVETAVPPSAVQAPIGLARSPAESLVPPRAATGLTWWVEADYLLWWIRGPLPTPLVTTGNPTDPLPGALGQPGTHALFGGSGLDYGSFSGGRITLGGWLDREHTFGFEGSGFLFEQRVVRFAVASDSSGNPPIYLPVVQQNPASSNFGRQDSFTIADPLYPGPGGTSGAVAASSATRLWGGELNGLANFARCRSWSLDGIVGFRYLDLQENLSISGYTSDHFDDLQQTFNDSFSTRNQFYGGQLGARFGFRSDRIALDVAGKVALGATHQVVDIEGSSIYGGTGFALPPGSFPGGVYTQPSNIGRTSANTFSVVPQVGLKLGVNLTPRITANVGYDFLYWSDVVRPGSQVDHNLNPTQFPGASFSGAPLPAPQFNRTDFLAHGVNFGFVFRY